MLLPIDVYRFHSIDIGLSVIIIFYLASQIRSLIIRSLLVGIIFIYSIVSLLGEMDLYFSFKKQKIAEKKLLNIVGQYPEKQVCTNNLNAPWVMINNPVAGLPPEANKFSNWKNCSIICIQEGDKWKVTFRKDNN